MRAILTYHSIDPSGSVVSVSPEVFRSHVDWLSRGEVRVVPVRRLLVLPPDAEAIAITFDDAFENFATLAWPLLRDAALPATLFVVTRRVGGHNDWNERAGGRHEIPELPLLDWEELGRLRDEGVEIGAHSRSHARLVGASRDLLRDEVDGSAEDLRRELGIEPEGFAYPYGEVDRPASEAVRRAYEYGCTTELRGLRAADEACERLPRLDAYYFRGPGTLADWGTTRFHGRLWTRGRLRAVRRGLARLTGSGT